MAKAVQLEALVVQRGITQSFLHDSVFMYVVFSLGLLSSPLAHVLTISAVLIMVVVVVVEAHVVCNQLGYIRTHPMQQACMHVRACMHVVYIIIDLCAEATQVHMHSLTM